MPEKLIVEALFRLIDLGLKQASRAEDKEAYRKMREDLRSALVERAKQAQPKAD